MFVDERPGGRHARGMSQTEGPPNGPPYVPRVFGRGRPAAQEQVTRAHAAARNQRFQPLPPPSSQPPYRLDLAEVLPPEVIGEIEAAGRLVLHMVGDTGGVNNPGPQHLVAAAMTADITALTPAGPAAPATGVPEPGVPRALYILGDVVYFYGEAEHYFGQFYEPYAGYPAPIFAVPGNHDGDLPPHPTVTSLAAYVENFDADSPHLTSEAGDSHRDAMTQPNPYWTLTTPLATIIGLYSNVPDGGQLEQTQIDWLHSELTAADPHKALIVTAHHPVYSGDGYHGGSSYLGGILDAASTATGRTPDLVLAGHVHNYQRCTHTRPDGTTSTYLVAGAGAGGDPNLTALAPVDGGPPPRPWPVPGTDVTLDTYVTDRHGYLLVDITTDRIHVTYKTVPTPTEPASNPAVTADTCTISLHTTNRSGGPAATR